MLLASAAVVLLLAQAIWAQAAKACADLTNLKIPGMDLVITKAEVVPATAGSPPNVTWFSRSYFGHAVAGRFA
jgi:hypothetical protein